MPTFEPIGRVESPLAVPRDAPKQADEGAPGATLVFFEPYREGLRDLRPGPPLGVFSTRSADRPNPIGVHRVETVAVSGLRVAVRSLEAVDGTRVLDVKPLLDEIGDR